MKLEISVEEVKELLKKETPVAVTTDDSEIIKKAVNQLLRIEGKEQLS